MPEIGIEKDDRGDHGRYVARIAGVEGEAELTFTRRNPKLINADHTGAPDSMRGTGAAKALVDAMIADARQSGFKIVPLCTYVQAQYRRHPEWSDVMVGPPGEAARRQS